ncbi:ethanolamine kinase 1-like isoform X2 [Limulus polyphemus]|uniref:ethanolamine kinase n=1 Tax=Limulus polyphemus TaxID=6850 RepID=A0ABM1S2K4_LIMPO|nr:ethanolamine kinase 1-like isoform X2 [Limulus polyphemus]
MPLQTLDITVADSSLEDLKKGSLEIVKHLKKNWNPNDIKVKVFTEGATNQLIGCFMTPNPDDMVLIRVYGRKTDLFVDRKAEVRNMELMNAAGLGTPVYSSFNNGLAYKYIPGVIVNKTMVCKPEIYRILSELPSKQELETEVTYLENHLVQLGSQIVFCHNDLLGNNIVYNEEKEKVTFIDFEYSDNNFQAFDIGNHFCEFAGLEPYQPELYPCKEFQKEWIKVYLEEWHYLKGCHCHITEVPPEDVNSLYVQVNKFALAAHLLWGMWSLVQASHSALDFDYLGYAKCRIGEYYKKKEKFLAL